MNGERMNTKYRLCVLGLFNAQYLEEKMYLNSEAELFDAYATFSTLPGHELVSKKLDIDDDGGRAIVKLRPERRSQ
jgi:hypothetical protein